eukprot:TRINITY_DN24185_c0_g1_i3.p1 TRINITY_DN24185_c0_g1~~TRINITY_DN24185_c0_g1_i3.p1  ORF type:complete len:530 (+),score=113.69 TRINITY_DN24185_c0_g1_i3:156-1745(+)
MLGSCPTPLRKGHLGSGGKAMSPQLAALGTVAREGGTPVKGNGLERAAMTPPTVLHPTAITSLADLSSEAATGSADGLPEEARGLTWPAAFCEAPRGERLELTEGGSKASRSSGVGRAVAFLGPLDMATERQAAYFEVDITELEASRSQTIAIGVCSTLPATSSKPLLAERARDLGRGFCLIGYDLPKLLVDGNEAAKVNTKHWRPLKDLAVGDRIGLLVESLPAPRLSVLVNGSSRVALDVPAKSAALTGTGSWPAELWGVVDIHGTLKSVRLRPPPQQLPPQRAIDVAAPAAAPAREEARGSTEQQKTDGLKAIGGEPVPATAVQTPTEAPQVASRQRKEGANAEAAAAAVVSANGNGVSVAAPSAAPQETVAEGAAAAAEAKQAEAPVDAATAAAQTQTAVADKQERGLKRRRTAARHPCGCKVHLVRHTGSVVHIEKDEFVIGRNPKHCDLTLDSEFVPGMVSRRHASISSLDDETVMVVDFESLNGTYVNARRISRETLRQSDVVVIGNPKQCPPDFCFTVSLP